MTSFLCGTYDEDKKDLIFCFPSVEGELKQLPLGLWKVIQSCYTEFNVFLLTRDLNTPFPALGQRR